MEQFLTARERVVAAALELFSAKSYANVALREVAECAGVSLAALHHRFPTKAALLDEVLQPFILAVDETLDAPCIETEPTCFLSTYLTVALRHRRQAKLLWSDRTTRTTAPGQKAAEQHRQIVSRLAGRRPDRERLIRIHSSLAVLRLAATDLAGVEPQHLGRTLLQISNEVYAGSS